MHSYEIMQFKSKFQIYYLISVIMGPSVRTRRAQPWGDGHLTQGKFLFLQFFSFVEDLPVFHGCRVRHL